jgi:ribosome modulation factor
MELAKRWLNFQRNKMNKEAYLQGYKAFEDGKSVHYNPYRNMPSDDEADWEEGWYDAKSDAEYYDIHPSQR